MLRFQIKQYQVLKFLLVLEFINYLLTTSFLNQLTTTIDIVLAVCFIIHYQFALKTKKISGGALILLTVLLIKVCIAENIYDCFLRASSLFVQMVLMYELPYQEIKQINNVEETFIVPTALIITKIVSLVTILNFIIISYSKMANIYILFGYKIGEPINGRYNGFFRTDAFCSELALICLIFFSIFYQKRRISISSFVYLASLGTIWLTGTRAAMVASAVFCFIILVDKSRKIDKKAIKWFSIVALSIILLGVIWVGGYSYLDRISSSRWSIWATILKDSIEKIGFLGMNDLEVSATINGIVYSGGTHNAFIQLIYNMGFIFTLLMIAYLITRLRKDRNISTNKKMINAKIIAGITAIIVFSFFEAHLFFFRCLISFSLWFLLLVYNIYRMSSEGK